MNVMDKVETIEELYKRKYDWVPESLKKEIGHFNIFKIEGYTGENAKPVPYVRRDYFKVTLAVGESEIHYADKIIKIEKQALVFSNPYIPYQWEHTEKLKLGYFCIFNHAFFQNFGNLNQYSAFQPKGTHVFDLADEQVEQVTIFFNKMIEEINSDYIHKYDVLRNIVFDLLHFASKMQPLNKFINQSMNANQRIALYFLNSLKDNSLLMKIILK